MQKRVARNMEVLFDIIAAGCDPGDEGPVVVEVTLWDGRKIIGSYYRRENPDVYPVVQTRDEVIWSDEELRPLLKQLLEEGTTFVTDTGEDDYVCTLRWEIHAGAETEAETEAEVETEAEAEV
jgi:hypothetical protein